MKDGDSGSILTDDWGWNGNNPKHEPHEIKLKLEDLAEILLGTVDSIIIDDGVLMCVQENDECSVQNKNRAENTYEHNKPLNELGTSAFGLNLREMLRDIKSASLQKKFVD